MTATHPDVDTARARDLDEAHVAWCMGSPVKDRVPFGAYAIGFLRKRGVIVARDVDHPDAVSLLQRGCTSDEVDDCDCQRPTPVPNGTQMAALLGVFASPYIEQAVVLSVEEVADLLAALAERDLRWIPGENGDCGTLLEGQPEPPNMHVVFDCFSGAWQRDDVARNGNDPAARWYGPNGDARPWSALCRDLGPLTPDGGIAPTTPRAQP